MTADINPYLLYCATFAVSLAISAYSVRKVLFITTRRKIYDMPDDVRKIHGTGIPSLGGIGIFTGYIVAAAFFMFSQGWNLIIASSVILFFTGIYDDLMNMSPTKKLLAQLIAAAIAVQFADVRITSLYGMFGIQELSRPASVVLTTLACTFFINVFNFIDGIDGLAGVSAVLYSALLGIIFAAMGNADLACISFSLAGAAIGLLFFNFSPARIYMGDTGSMVLGFTIFILCVLFVNTYSSYSLLPQTQTAAVSAMIHAPVSALMIAVAILFFPIYDGLRVFIIRATKGVSPLKADRAHLHYYLLDAGCSHSQAVLVITLTELLIIATAFLMQGVTPWLVLLCMAMIASLVAAVVYTARQKRLKAIH
jgi:UDP-GlcNAc:undecaprenyl-phosphate/decaprenyl-phosphate GlcNAc-1-phosphate transferase